MSVRLQQLGDPSYDRKVLDEHYQVPVHCGNCLTNYDIEVEIGKTIETALLDEGRHGRAVYCFECRVGMSGLVVRGHSDV